jgi:hypothetical protein
MEMMTASILHVESHAAGAPAGLAALPRRDRKEAGQSLEMLARKVETSPAYLFRLEKGTATNSGRNFTKRSASLCIATTLTAWTNCSRPEATCRG